MRISHIKSNGLKGRSINLALDDVSVIIGPNASGKSAILDAILLAILGYRPGWGRTVDDVLHAADGDMVEVTATVVGVNGGCDAVTIRRTWERLYYKRGAKRGEFKKVEQGVWCSTLSDGAHQKDHEAEIRRIFGLSDDKTHRSDQEHCLDVEAFLALSHDRRRIALFRVASDLLTRHWGERLAQEEVLLKYATGSFGGGSPIVWLEGLWSDAVESLAAVRAQRREADAAIEGLDEERDDNTKAVDPVAVGRLKAAVDVAVEAEKEAAARNAEGAKGLDAKIRAAVSLNADIENARKKVTEISEKISQLRSPSGDDPFQSAVQSEIDSMEAPWGPNSLACLRQITEDTKAAAEKPIDTSELDTADELVAQLELVVESARGDLGSLNADVARAKALSADIIKIEAAGTGACPTCRQRVGVGALEAMRDALAPLNQAIDRAVEVEVKIQDKESQLGRARDMRSKLQQRINDNKAKEGHAYRDAVDQVRTVETRMVELRHQLTTAQSGDNAEAIGRLESSLAAQNDTAAKEMESTDNLHSGLQRFRAEALAEVEALATTTREARDVFDAANRLLEGHRMSLSLRAKAAELRVAEKKASDLVSDLGPRGVLGRVAATVLDPFKAAVNGLLGQAHLGTFDVQVFDEDRNRPVLRMGLVRNGTMAPVETLSGGEATAVRAGISLALATVSELPWRPILVDEVEGVDDGRQVELMEQVSAAVKDGSASQAIIMGCWWNGPSATVAYEQAQTEEEVA